jgi:hypothetical protein
MALKRPFILNVTINYKTTPWDIRKTAIKENIVHRKDLKDVMSVDNGMTQNMIVVHHVKV